jgi:TfoX/Sxy family transcriptional regulator of competence genes
MAYDEALSERIREMVAKERGLTEKKMFGGLAFLVGGNMAIAASGQGGVLVRVDPEQSDTLVRTTKATVAVMQGRDMPGWLRLSSEDVRTTPQLRKWVTLGTTFARSLPAKKQPATKPPATKPRAKKPPAKKPPATKPRAKKR